MSRRAGESGRELAVILGLLAAIVLCGVAIYVSTERAQAEIRRAEALHLPAGARRVEDLGGGWTYFELAAGRRERRFLVHHEAVGRPGDTKHIFETVVELQKE